MHQSPGKPEGRAGPENIAHARLVVEAAKDVSQPDMLPVPATFFVGQHGVVLRSCVNIGFTQRAEPGEILQALHHLQALRAL